MHCIGFDKKMEERDNLAGRRRVEMDAADVRRDEADREREF